MEKYRREPKSFKISWMGVPFLTTDSISTNKRAKFLREKKIKWKAVCSGASVMRPEGGDQQRSPDWLTGLSYPVALGDEHVSIIITGIKAIGGREMSPHPPLLRWPVEFFRPVPVGRHQHLQKDENPVGMLPSILPTNTMTCSISSAPGEQREANSPDVDFRLTFRKWKHPISLQLSINPIVTGT